MRLLLLLRPIRRKAASFNNSKRPVASIDVVLIVALCIQLSLLVFTQTLLLLLLLRLPYEQSQCDFATAGRPPPRSIKSMVVVLTSRYFHSDKHDMCERQ
jgi:hypothetical protein